MSYRFEPLGSSHDRESFDCGIPALNDYLSKFARKDAQRLVAATFVMVSSGLPERIVGYYTLSAFTVEVTELPEALRKKLPRYPKLPATLIGRLARDVNHPGSGSLLLVDALCRAYSQSASIASMAVVTEAKNETAASFYQKFGFQSLGESHNRFFLPMGTVEALMPK